MVPYFDSRQYDTINADIAIISDVRVYRYPGKNHGPAIVPDIIYVFLPICMPLGFVLSNFAPKETRDDWSISMP
jgi:hypothetical protein